MYETLFGSKTRVKLLSLMLTNPGHAFYVREITRKIDEQINSVRRELLNLKAIGLVKSSEKRGKVYYEVNPKFEFFSELKKMFDKANKNMDGDDKLAVNMRRAGDVYYASLLGGFVGDTASQVDLFIVGTVDKRRLKPILAELEKELGREVNFCIMDQQEYEDRKMLFDRFLTELESGPKKVLVNYLDAEVKEEEWTSEKL